MEGAARVFAGEFNAATLQVPGDGGEDAPWIVTPGGEWCRRMFIVGALTERIESGDMIRCRLADPTGVFELVAGGRNSALAEAIRDLPVPSFVSVTGSARMYLKNDTCLLSVRPEEVRPVERSVRDQWVLTTAEHTLRRLELLESALQPGCSDERFLVACRHYTTAPASIRCLYDIVEHAVTTVKPAESIGQEIAGPVQSGPDARAFVTVFLELATGPRGTSVEEIIANAATAGFPGEAVLAAIEGLIVDDECYQPQKGFVKRL